MGNEADGTELAVEPEALDHEAAALYAAAAEAARLARLVSGVEVAALGSRSSAALRSCVGAWGQWLAALGTDLDDYADRLLVTAGNYRAAEAESCAGMLSAGLRPELRAGRWA
ncbi:hypothetical protein [Streptacidiphilus sp. EB129]|uniref:hypothetical protein n=1 Tax=Streptacidiphilus sp. EB129 TaxID=3156262 RepID=UPI0035177C72